MKSTLGLAFLFALVLAVSNAGAQSKIRQDAVRMPAQRLEGSWQIDAALTQRLSGSPTWDLTALTIRTDSSVVAKIPESRKAAFPAAPFIAGFLGPKDRTDGTPFVVFDLSGGYVMTLFYEHEGNPFGKAMNLRLVLVQAREQKDDILALTSGAGSIGAFSRAP